MALGIRVLVDPVTDTKADSHQNGCLVDIVAIHGIGAHPDDTWTGRDANGKKIYWLSNDDKDNPMLPQAIPRARIMRFGYMSDWNGTSGRNKRTYVSDVADMLLRELEFHRRDQRVARPIIFIAHSYGGLVLIKALRMSFDSPNRWANPFRSTIGIAFFGTPFRGRRGLSFEQVVDAIAQGDQEQTSSEHRSYPETMALADEENPYLQDIVKRFTETRCGDNPIPLRFFYETLPSPINKIFPPGSGINDVNHFLVSNPELVTAEC
ncbi:hypothetical protein GGR51DRAFT_28597 [Nemania sp. FL0031]|nr:hypothetical protein GGR51DRAFT_28597 [Nemania sp. FL0031]